VGENQNFTPMTHTDIYVWALVLLFGALAGYFRVSTDGAWKNTHHAIGVIGTSSLLSFGFAALFHWCVPSINKYPHVVVAVSGALGALGKDAAEKIMFGSLSAIAARIPKGDIDDTNKPKS